MPQSEQGHAREYCSQGEGATDSAGLDIAVMAKECVFLVLGPTNYRVAR